MKGANESSLETHNRIPNIVINMLGAFTKYLYHEGKLSKEKSETFDDKEIVKLIFATISTTLIFDRQIGVMALNEEVKNEITKMQSEVEDVH